MSQLIVALDFPSQRDALALVDELGDPAGYYKVGLELYTSEGPGIVRALKGRGKKVFLDLKLLDIPNTVHRAVRAAAELGADLVTVHAQGGTGMLQAAVDAAGRDIRVVAVTLLTSLTAVEVEEVWNRSLDSMLDEVLRLATLSVEAGADGVVASPLEARALRRALGPDPMVVTPGIRLPGADRHDQARVAAPDEAVRAGASHLVVGRAVTAARSPSEALRSIRASMDTAMKVDR
ncbi:MAG: orotidine-5'-phosphate decarboxylase [Gemmatimonadales bacterium]|jgi:orotidine-5'-phosphate decarboxylase|nr:MAG: orotidine-5'-phosphate decarboxylase [Gemmatimonadales bacterium]